MSFIGLKSTDYYRDNCMWVQMSLLRYMDLHASRAVELMVREYDEEDTAALHAGVALESCAKVALACYNMALLLPDRSINADTLHVLCGTAPVGETDVLSKITTVGGHQACLRLKRADPEFPYSSDDQIVFATRDAVAHGSGVTDDSCLASVAKMVRLVEWVDRKYLSPEKPFRLWVNNGVSPAAQAMHSEPGNRSAWSAAQKLHDARERYKVRVSGLSSEQAQDLAELLNFRFPLDFDGYDEIARFQCPACEARCWASVHRLAESETFSVNRVRCGFCDFDAWTDVLGELDVAHVRPEDVLRSDRGEET